MTREDLFNRVILQLKKDIENGEQLAIEQLLNCVNDEALESYLSEIENENT